MPNTIEINDSDGQLHFYVCAAFNGDRWIGQLIFDPNEMTVEHLKYQGKGLVDATVRSLVKKKIVNE